MENHKKTSARLASFLAEIWTRDPPE
jgi:hypothetical protein